MTYKTRRVWAAGFAALLLTLPLWVQAQLDDLYYNPSDDAYYDVSSGSDADYSTYNGADAGGDYETYGGGGTTYEPGRDDGDFYGDDYDYYYSSRIRRFQRNRANFGFYDPFFTDMFFYDPFFSPGMNIYLMPGRGWNSWHWNNFNSWNYWNPGFAYDPFWNPYWNQPGMFIGYNPYFYNPWNSFAFCPPGTNIFVNGNVNIFTTRQVAYGPRRRVGGFTDNSLTLRSNSLGGRTSNRTPGVTNVGGGTTFNPVREADNGRLNVRPAASTANGTLDLGRNSSSRGRSYDSDRANSRSNSGSIDAGRSNGNSRGSYNSDSRGRSNSRGSYRDNSGSRNGNSGSNSSSSGSYDSNSRSRSSGSSGRSSGSGSYDSGSRSRSSGSSSSGGGVSSGDSNGRSSGSSSSGSNRSGGSSRRPN